MMDSKMWSIFYRILVGRVAGPACVLLQESCWDADGTSQVDE
jgi:hypothetical protein